MATINPPKKISKRHELREDKVVTFYARAWEYFDRNRTLVYGIIAGVIVLVLAVVGYAFYHARQSDRAQELLGEIVSVYEAGNYQEALDGTGDRAGLLEIADGYGRTDAGNLARFYAATALYELGENDRALAYFGDFDKPRNLIGASAIAGEAAIHEAREEFDKAAARYRRAAEHFENELTSPQYLLSAGRAYELAGNYDRAREAYETIRDDYSESDAAANIEVYIARAEARSNVRS